ncbi:MAG: NACHT domain-containing protein [Candidatus Competibacteraceae bacterium]|nr:MAG: NACHT domain-containing protein [Candidatus Competibacteraceae bacterium]
MVPPADVLIVTATKVESKAVLDAFAELTGQPARIVNKNRRTYRDLGAVGGTRVFLALTEMGSGGLGASQQAVQKGIEALRPGAVLLVGIAFGVDEKKQRIGDILISQQLQLYDLQRVGADRIVLRGDKPHASARLIDYFRQADLDWDEPKVEFGLVLSGEKLVDNRDYREQLQRLAPEALGGEMEGAGLYVACQEAKVDWIVVKAICDWADGSKAQDKDARQRLAARNAVAFVAHALQRAPLKRPESPMEQPPVAIQNTGPGAVAIEGGAAAGAGGVAVGGNVHGGIHLYSAPAPATFSPALREAYLRRVMERCGALSLTGIDPAAAGQRDTDPQLRLNAVYTALLTRSPRQEEGDDLEPRGSKKRTEEEPLRSALEQLDREQRLVLQGDPGSGKSTFVNFVALCLAGEALQDEQANLRHLTAPLPDEEGEDGKERQPWRHGALLPVPVVLRDFVATGLPERGEATAKTLWNFVAQELKENCQQDCVPWLWQELRERGGLLLLDGLDEVPEAEQRREQVKRAVEAFAQGFGNCRILVTSRTYAYQNQGWRLQGFNEATLAPFSDGQIRRFVARWYELTADLDRLPKPEATGRAELLKRAIFNRPTLHELAQRPLLLTLMASLHAWRSGDLPERREALYAETVDLLLNRWEQRLIQREAQGQCRLIQPSLAEYLKTDKDQVRAVLEALAFEAHRAQPDLADPADIAEKDLVYRLFALRNNPDANPKRLVEYLRDRAGLLYPRGVGVYTFPHRSFQEYLAACHLTDEDYPDRIAELTRAEPNRWREVALLAGAKAARGTVAGLWQLVDALCFREPNDPAVEPADVWGAQIAAQALSETANLAKVGPANQRKLARVQQWLVKLLRDERLPPTERALAGDNLAALGDPRFDAEHGHLPAEPLFGFVEIPAGSFKMGSDKRRDGQAYDDELPQHEVNLSAYYVACWPVIVAQFAAFVGDGGHEPADPDCLKGIANHPVVRVSWHDAMAYCRWLNEQLRKLAPKRLATADPLSESERRFWQGLADGSLGIGLPSEAEWEKAARGDDGRIYPWGHEPDPNCANYSDTGLNRTNAVGCFPGGASPYGCEEMSGNVWEWTRTLSALNSFPLGDGVVALHHGLPNYPYPLEGSERQAQEDLSAFTSRVLRGGAFSRSSGVVRCVNRIVSSSDHGSDGFGFRVVVSPLLL